MQKNKSFLINSALMLGLTVGGGTIQPALADTALNITGTIKASPCTVSDNGGSGISVNLGDNIEATSLAAPSSASGWVQFNIPMSNCPTTTQQVSAAFSGTVAEESATLYKSTGTASRVQIELQDSAGNNQGNGTTLIQPVNATTHEATFPLRVRAYSSQGGATPGSILGRVVVSFTYI